MSLSLIRGGLNRATHQHRFQALINALLAVFPQTGSWNNFPGEIQKRTQGGVACGSLFKAALLEKEQKRVAVVAMALPPRPYMKNIQVKDHGREDHDTGKRGSVLQYIKREAASKRVMPCCESTSPSPFQRARPCREITVKARDRLQNPPVGRNKMSKKSDQSGRPPRVKFLKMSGFSWPKSWIWSLSLKPWSTSCHEIAVS